MRTSPAGTVEITTEGRSGTIRYTGSAGTVPFYWEYGGGEVLVVIQVSDAVAWRAEGTWFAEQRAAILRAVADEAIRQKAPRSHAGIDAQAGTITLRQTAPAPPAPQGFSRRTYHALRSKLALGVLVAAVIFGGVMWFKRSVLTIDPGKGTPVGTSVRTDAHIATLIQTLEPYTPSLDRNHGKDTYRISLFLVPLDGSRPKHIPLVGGLSPNAFSLAKILGSDGRTLWYDVGGTGGVDLRSFTVVDAGREPDPAIRLQGAQTGPLAPRIEACLAAGYFTGPHSWLGLLSDEEAGHGFKPGSWLKRVVAAEDARQPRRFHRGELDPDSNTQYHRIVRVTPLDSTTYLNAAFLRMNDASEPFRLHDPEGAWMIHTSAPGLKGTLVVARVDDRGQVLWSVDTGIDRFKLGQILPGERSMAFIGTRPPEPGKVSEPILVIVDPNGGSTTTSLFQ